MFRGEQEVSPPSPDLSSYAYGWKAAPESRAARPLSLSNDQRPGTGHCVIKADRQPRTGQWTPIRYLAPYAFVSPPKSASLPRIRRRRKQVGLAAVARL